MSNLTKRLLGLAQGSQSAPTTSDVRQNEPVQADNTNDIHRSSYLGLQDAVLSGWYQNATKEVFRGIPIGPEDTVVDVGCGDGGSSVFCASLGAHVTAVDIDPAVIAHIKGKLDAVPSARYDTLLSDGNPLPLADAVATRVLCTEVLEHVDDPDQLLAELVRIGKPQARYLFTVPGSQQENLQKLVAPPSYFSKPNHIRIINRADFARMVERSGLVIEEQTQYGFFWSVWWAMFWACDVDLSKPDHPALEHWTEAWRAILSMPNGTELKRKLDQFLPKSEVIVARKP